MNVRKYLRTPLAKIVLVLVIVWAISLLLLLFAAKGFKQNNTHDQIISSNNKRKHKASSSSSSSSSSSTPSSSGRGADLLNHLQEKYGGAKKKEASTDKNNNNNNKNRQRKSATGEKIDCFAVVVSNEEYLDGVLVLGYSLLHQSILAQRHDADLVVIVPEGALSADSIERLLLAGWTSVLQVDDLAKKAPKAHWAGTFNKLYLFNLTQYSLVAFFDADMLMQHNPDYIFHTTKLKDYRWIGALGNSLFDRHGKPRPAYFQTGMMLIIPADKTFQSMMDDFYHSKDARSINGRDGLIIRRFFNTNYKNLDDALSAHVATTNDYGWVTGLHFRGGFKPWFNRNKVAPYDKDEIKRLKHKFYVEKKSERKSGEEFIFPPKGKWLEVGPAYTLWWETYEKFHDKVILDYDLSRMKEIQSSKKEGEVVEQEEKEEEDWKMTNSYPSEYDPRTHVWMMRHSKKSYIQLKHSVARQKRDEKAASIISSSSSSSKLLLGEKGWSCEAVCANSNLLCHDDVLASSKLQSCETVKKFLSQQQQQQQQKEKGVASSLTVNRCRRGCEPRSAPTNTQPDTLTCGFNLMLNPFITPWCNASAEGVQRVCLCYGTLKKNNQITNSDQEKEKEERKEKDTAGEESKKEKDGDEQRDKKENDEDGEAGKHKHRHHHHDHHHSNKNKNKKKNHDSPSSVVEEDSPHICKFSYLLSSLSSAAKKNLSNQQEVAASLLEPSSQCVTRLSDIKHPGSWSVLFQPEKKKHQHEENDNESDDEGDDDSNKKKNKKKEQEEEEEEEEKGTATTKRRPIEILARHHDQVSQIFWFPQRKVPYLLQRVLISHIVARFLGIFSSWIPPTVVVEFPLRSLPKRLQNAAKNHQRQHQQHSLSKEQKQKQEKQVDQQLVSYIVPVTCPEVISGKGGEEEDSHDNNEGWQVQAVTSWYESSSSSSLFFDTENKKEFSQAQVLFFILGIPFQEGRNKEVESWEDLIAKFDSATTQELVSNAPSCVFLQAGGIGHYHVIALEKILRLLSSSDKDNNNNSNNNNERKRQEEFVEISHQDGKGRYRPEFWKVGHDESTWKILRRGNFIAAKMLQRVRAVLHKFESCP